MGITETKNLTEEEVIAIVTRELPRLITEYPEIHDKFIDVMSDVFAQKSDQAVLLSELKTIRQDFNVDMKALREDFQTSREEFQVEMKNLREEFQTSREEFQIEMKNLREEFQAEIKTLREEFQAEMRALRAESDQRFEEHSREIKALREDFQSEIKALREELQALREDMQSGLKALDNKVVGLGARWGIMSEETFRSGLKGILTDELGLKVEHYQGYDEEGYVSGHPDQVELDLVVKDGLLIIIEIRSSMSKSDVYTFQRKIDFYEKVHDVGVNRKIILSPFIDYQAVPAAHRLGIEMYSSASEVRA